MRYPTEYVVYIDDKDIYNNQSIVENIKNLTKREERTMLENEKVSKLEQLNSFRSEYELKLEELKAKDINSLIEEIVAESKAEIEKKVVEEHNNEISKIQFKIDAINDMILDVESIEVEAVEVESIEVEAVEDVQDEVPAEEITEEIAEEINKGE